MPIILPPGPVPTGRTFSDLLTEFYARGFTYLDDGGPGEVRAKRWINDAMQDIDDQFDWPYLWAETTETAPATITDLRRVLSVVNVGESISLAYADERTLTSYYVDTTIAGTGQVYYLTGGNTINTYPVSNAVLTIRYLIVAPDMSASTDRPLMPDRYRSAIVDYAVASALMDKNNLEEASAARSQGDGVIERMRDSLLLQAGPDRILVTNPGGDW